MWVVSLGLNLACRDEELDHLERQSADVPELRNVVDWLQPPPKQLTSSVHWLTRYRSGATCDLLLMHVTGVY